MRIFKQTYKDRRGQTRETAKWYAEFRDHLERVRRLSLFTDHRASEEAGRRIETLVALKVAGAEPDAGMQKWLSGIDNCLRQKLAGFGLLDIDRMEASRPLVEHLEDWKAATLARGTGEHHADQ
ncbi:MAG: hypothetical protein L6Q38_03355, partial [Nitrospira sp.]|nr:hypothetical protein [Nitrospira sp.]